MQRLINQLDRFHETKAGYAVFALFGLVIAYVFASYSIDTGNWFDYLITLLAIIVFLQNGGKLLKDLIKPKTRRGRQ